MLTNTPLHTIDEYRVKIEAANNSSQLLMVPAGTLEWLINDARHLLSLNDRAINLDYSDAESALEELFMRESY